MKKMILILLLGLSVSCFAANEVQLAYGVGNNLYFRVFNSSGEIWSTAGTPAFEAWSDPNVADYDIAMNGTGGSFYLGTFPDLDDGSYTVVAYLRAGGSPAVSDGVISAGLMEWGDSEEIDILSRLADLAMPRTRAGRTQR